MGLLRPASREGTPEPIPLLPPKQAAPASSLPHSSEGSPPPPVSNKPLRASAPLITKRIKRTQTWQELEAVVAAEGRNFNHIHVSAAMVHLAKLLQGAATQEQTLPTGSSGPSSERERHGGAHGVEGSPQHGQESTSGSDRDGGGGGMISSTDESGPSRGSRGNSMSNAPGSQWAPPPSSNAQAPAPIALSPGSLTEQKQPEPATLHAPRAHGRRRPSVSLALQPPGVRALLDSLIRLVHRELQVLDVQGVANTLYTLAVLRVPDMRLVDELMRVGAGSACVRVHAVLCVVVQSQHHSHLHMPMLPAGSMCPPAGRIVPAKPRGVERTGQHLLPICPLPELCAPM